MKSLTTLLSVLLCVALAVAGAANGIRNGWLAEREQALSLQGDLSALNALFDERAMDAANLAVVAARHLPADDNRLQLLKAAQQTLFQGHADLQELTAAEAVIRDIAADLAQHLPSLASVQASARDQVYVTMLTQALLADSNVQSLIAASAKAFNNRLETAFTGPLARLLGVTPLPAE